MDPNDPDYVDPAVAAVAAADAAALAAAAIDPLAAPVAAANPAANALNDNEVQQVFGQGGLFGDICTYLSGGGGINMTADQKNAFLHLALGIGLPDAVARFHPNVGVDPLHHCHIETIADAARVFRDPPVIAAPVAPVVAPAAALAVIAPPDARRTTFGHPVASSTFDYPLAPLSGPADPDVSAALLHRLTVLEDQVKINNKMNRSSFIPNYDESDFLIAPPSLGSSTSAAAAVKSLKVLFGQEKYSLDDPECTPLRNVLPLVSQIIESHKLNGSNSYLCLLSILKGDLNTVVNNYMADSKPFHDIWRHIQLMSQGTYSRESVEKEIRKLVNTKPVSVSQTFSRLQNLYKKLYQYVQDTSVRAAIINNRITEDIYKIVAHFYPSSYSQIENIVENQRRLSDDTFDEVSSLIETAISYITRRQVSLGPESHVAAMSVTAEPQVMAMTVQPQQQPAPHVSPAPAQAPAPQFIQQPFQQNQPQQHQQRYRQNSNNGRNQGFRNNSNNPRYNNGGNNYRPGPPQGPFSNGQPSNGQGSNNPADPNAPFHMDVSPGCCFKCNTPNHWARNCTLYSLPTIRRHCRYCKGYHQEKCVTLNGRNNNQFQRNNGNNGSNPGNPGSAQASTKRGSVQGQVYAKNTIGTGQQLPLTSYLNPMEAQATN